MRTTIDAAGRLVIPRVLREKAGLQAGMEIEVVYRDGLIEIKPALAQVKLVQEGRWLVAEGVDAGPLTADIVNETVRKVRMRRAD